MKLNSKVVYVVLKKPVALVSNGLFGENHPLSYRCVVGVGIMVVGVNIAHVSEMVSIGVIKLSLDGIGYLIHGLGAVPFIDILHNLTDKLGSPQDNVKVITKEFENHGSE